MNLSMVFSELFPKKRELIVVLLGKVDADMRIDAKTLRNEQLKGDYREVVFHAPEICRKTQPGQFVHARIASLRDRILRRPFSICDVDSNGALTVVYKVVGRGTAALAETKAGDHGDLMGPLGNGFSTPLKDEFPVIVAGGYGAAATYLVAKRSPLPGVLLLGARSEEDLLLESRFADLGFKVRIATEDGSVGTKGLVTDLLDDGLASAGTTPRVFACGPRGMLMALGKALLDRGLSGELSLDHLMCCGVGACFACVVKVKADNADGWRYARTCKEGPVFRAEDVYYETPET